jgi:hypothetical protein
MTSFLKHIAEIYWVAIIKMPIRMAMNTISRPEHKGDFDG